MRAPDLPLLFVGRDVERDRQEMEKRSIPFYGLRLEGLRRRWSLRNPRAVFRFGLGGLRCLWILSRRRRGVVFGVGGYVSAPAMAAGKVLGWSLILHEQNTVPGLVNRRLARWCDTVLVTFEKTRDYWPNLPCVRTGFPLRREILESARVPVSPRETEMPTLLVMGGSQGAKALVERSLAAFRMLETGGVRLRAIVQTGERNYEWATALEHPGWVTLIPFIEDMAAVYAQTDLVIGRAGSGSLAEISCWGLPSILIPYPFAGEDHQRINAEVYAQAGAAELIPEPELSPETLAERVRSLLRDTERRTEMGRKAKSFAHEGAADRIVEEILRRLESFS